MSVSRSMHLALVIGDVGFHQAAWRLDGSHADQLARLDVFKSIAQRAEQANLDSLFVADVLGFDVASVESWPTNQLEPLTLLSALSAVTQKIGLIGTQSSTFNEAYSIARQFLSLDHLSNGRAGWNVVTSRSGQQHYGLEHLPSHDDRYERAEEVAIAVKKLWESWQPDAIVLNKHTGIYATAEKIQEVEFNGQHIKLKGALPSPRSIQNRPVIVQAGSSEEGRNFAAQHADIVFTMQPSASDAKAFYQDVKRRAVSFGRNADDLKVFQGITPFVAETIDEAVRIKNELDELTDYTYALARFQLIFKTLSVTIEQLNQGFTTKQLQQMQETEKSTTALKLYQLASSRATLKAVLNALVTARGHWTPVGTIIDISNQMQQRVNEYCTDGFIILPSDLHHGLNGFLDGIVPHLKRNHAFRDAYTGETLRAHLGLKY
ncbi:hypothetical protein B9T31_08985 [Acinetobacter sp. ANC 4558]|uniref:NtaA/DmoA family FMN-dependent monooxygenase n=1 Tax=Acinetobacter sp. ANC 4558 TaxID=1977876 RepID=UPI000A34C1D8|nr:NtaA/DmoA family FMN-dependent monooxygenase [Acinetobacter sp. ANC 4558]OTG86163.1 hypothetical protein B9T31_08985 [Acinetobacter sp. ANC 4558]